MNKIKKNSPCLSVSQVAAHTKVSKETIYPWLKEERIPAHRTGKFWRFHIDEVDSWIFSKDTSVDVSKNEYNRPELK